VLKRVGPILDKPALHVLVWKAGNIAERLLAVGVQRFHVERFARAIAAELAVRLGFDLPLPVEPVRFDDVRASALMPVRRGGREHVDDWKGGTEVLNDEVISRRGGHS